jgi:hypothetical protein
MLEDACLLGKLSLGRVAGEQVKAAFFLLHWLVEKVGDNMGTNKVVFPTT